MTASVSVVVPVYNGERYLAEALASVNRQTFPPAEVLVVDDGSDDGSAGVAEQCGPRVRVLRQAHAGAGAARNRGIREAGGDLVAFLDGDDLWPRDRLALLVARLAGPPPVDLAFGGVEHFFSPELEDDARARLRCPRGCLPAALAGTMVGRLSVVRRVGPMAEDLVVGEFVEWMVRAREAGCSEGWIDDCVLRRRIHGQNQGIARRDASRDYLRVVRDVLSRRRGGSGDGTP